MTTSLDTVYAWRELPSYRRSRRRQSSSSPLPLRELQLISDPALIRNLPIETPVFASSEEAHAFLRDSNPAPDINLTYIHDGSHSHYGSRSHFVDIMDTPLYCGPDSPDTLKALSFRFPSIWVPSHFASSNLPFPLHVTTKTCLHQSYTLVLNSPSVIQRVNTRRSNIASRIEALVSGGPLLPLSLFKPLHSYLHSVSLYPPSPRITHLKNNSISDSRPSILQSLQSHLLSIPDPSHYHAPNPLSRHLRDSIRTRRLLLTLLPFIPHLPLLVDPSPLKATPYIALHSHLISTSAPYWAYSSGRDTHCPLYDEGLSASHKPYLSIPSTTNGTLLAALIAREIRIGLRLQNLTLTRARALLPS